MGKPPTRCEEYNAAAGDIIERSARGSARTDTPPRGSPLSPCIIQEAHGVVGLGPLYRWGETTDSAERRRGGKGGRCRRRARQAQPDGRSRRAGCCAAAAREGARADVHGGSARSFELLLEANKQPIERLGPYGIYMHLSEQSDTSWLRRRLDTICCVLLGESDDRQES
ncbi:hypothetical protein MRX96_009549 [Rhipicephalus microplus]